MKKVLRISLLLIVLSATLVFMSACSDDNGSADTATVAPSEVIKWRMVTHQMPGTSRYEDTVVPFVEAVEKASGGRLIIEPYGAGVLFPVTDTLDSVRTGVVEMSASWDGNWAGTNPIFALAGCLPTDPITTFSEHFYRAERLEPILSKAYEEYGITYIGGLDFGPLEILMTKEPVKTLEDFQGLNIRAAGIGGDFYSRLGASVVTVASNEIYTSLQTGTVDAAEYNDWIVNMEMGFHEVTDYVIEPVLHTGAITDKSVTVNNDAWNNLPDDLKSIVLSCLDVAKMKSATAFEVGSKLSMEEFLDGGAEIIELSEEDVAEAREIAAEVILEYSEENDLAKEYVDTYIEVLVELGYIDHARNLGYSGN